MLEFFIILCSLPPAKDVCLMPVENYAWRAEHVSQAPQHRWPEEGKMPACWALQRTFSSRSFDWLTTYGWKKYEKVSVCINVAKIIKSIQFLNRYVWYVIVYRLTYDVYIYIYIWRVNSLTVSQQSFNHAKAGAWKVLCRRFGEGSTAALEEAPKLQNSWSWLVTVGCLVLWLTHGKCKISATLGFVAR